MKTAYRPLPDRRAFKEEGQGASLSQSNSLPGFVTLPENQSAFQAIESISSSLCAARRATVLPLVLHGPPGTGKSRLIALLLEQLAAGPAVSTARVVSAGDLARTAPEADDAGFTDPDLVGCDLLVIEDVQLLPEREAGAVCELIDRRVARRKALVVTGNVGPAALSHLPRRLTSRLASGLVVQMEPLSPPSRRLVLEAAAAARNLALTPEAVAWLVSQSSGGGVRPLLGLLNNLAAAGRPPGQPLSRSVVEKIISGTGQPTSTRRDVGGIVKGVAAAFGVRENELLGTSRLRRVVVPRQVAMYLARDLCGLSLPSLGAAFGGRDHTTVLYSCQKVEARLTADHQLAGMVRQLRAELA